MVVEIQKMELVLSLDGYPAPGFSMKVTLKKDMPLKKVLKAFAERLASKGHDIDLSDLVVHSKGKKVALSTGTASLENAHLLVTAPVTKEAERLLAGALDPAQVHEAQRLLGQGLKSDASKLAEEALHRLKRSTGDANRELVVALLFVAGAADDKFDRARRRYEVARCLASKQQRKVIAHNLCVLLASTNCLQEAIEIAKETADENKDDPEVWYEYGCVAFSAGDPSAAGIGYRGALRADKQHVPSYVNFVQSTKDMAEAKQVAAEAIKNGVLWAHADQRPPHFFKDLPARPWHTPSKFWFCSLLEDAHSVIKAEFLQDSLGTEVGTRPGFAHDGDIKVTGSWREAVFFAGHSPGAAEATRRRFPRTASILLRISDAVTCADVGCGEVLFSTLAPGTVLRPHCGGTNARLTCHLGVVVPSEEDITITCGGETRHWVEGKCIVFDDSFQHDVKHQGRSHRTVLLLNFWHPDVPPEKRTSEWRSHAMHSSTLDAYNLRCS